MVRISDEPNKIHSAKFVSCLQLLLMLFIFASLFHPMIVLGSILIGGVFIFGFMTSNTIHLDGETIIIEDSFGKIRKVGIDKVYRIFEGGGMRGSYTIVYRLDTGDSQSTTFIARTDGILKKHKVFNQFKDAIEKNVDT